ncbi:hypothetical protein [Chroococcidiopsis sp.]|uniref:hypothetical protein n=1 Tax=Chroococcidiopsis sp. TaxID=3088168 RepID=UPI003F2A9DF3
MVRNRSFDVKGAGSRERRENYNPKSKIENPKLIHAPRNYQLPTTNYQLPTTTLF